MSSWDNDEGTTSWALPPSDPEPSDLSSDEFPETPPIKVAIVFKGRNQVKSSGLDDSEDMSRQAVLDEPGAFLSTVPCALTATTQRQFVGELDISSPKESSAKKMSSGKREERLSLLPQATPGKKAPQEKKFLGGSVSKVVPERKFQAYLSRGPLAPATFPPISGPPGLGNAVKYSLVPLGPQQPKHNTRKKPVVSRKREGGLAVQEDTKPNKEPALKGQFLANRPGPSRLSMYRGEYNSKDSKIQFSQVPGNPQLLAMARGGVKPRVPPPSGDRGPLLHPARQERKQPPPGTQCCPQCPVLQREIDNLKDQLVAMQCLIDNFQIL